MATNLSAWYDDVLPHVNGCPAPVALQKIRAAAIAWAKKTRCWRHLTLTPLDAVAGQQSYVIGAGATVGTLPADTQVVHVYEVLFNGTPLGELTLAQFRALSDTWFSDLGDPEYFTLFNEGEVSLWSIPSANAVGAIRIPDVALAPTETALTVIDALYQRHRHAIAVGARARIHRIPKKPYTDANEAAALEREFEALAGAVEARVASGRGVARLRTKTIIR